MPAPAPAVDLEDPLTVLPGIGPARARQLREHLGAATIGELLRLPPRRYEAPTSVQPLATVEEGTLSRVRVRVTGASLLRRGRRSFLRVAIADESGRAVAWFFQQPWLRDRFPRDREMVLEGRLRASRGGPAFHAPRVLPAEDLERSEWRPVYPAHEGLPRGLQARAVTAALHGLGRVADPLPSWLLQRAGVPPLDLALRELHRPSRLAAAESARRRLALGEVLERERRRLAAGPALRAADPPRRAGNAAVWARIRARLPFRTTPDQEAVLEALRLELASGSISRRLLHGEVGSGKTVVAFALALAMAAEGRQSALLAPTEILARQHEATFRAWLAGAQLRVASLLGEHPPPRRREVLRELREGGVSIVIGTHVLLGPEVRFRDLGLVIFDEQHRFGVRQKAALLAKGESPHVLTMTATPIPRTLAWARHGALDPLTLRSRPGQGLVRTRVLGLERLPGIAAALRRRLRRGQKAFVVVPHIDGSDGLLARARQLLRGGPWRGVPAALVHGRMAGSAIEAEVRRFRDGEAAVLLGTTVVEVGLDVPAVRWMLVLDAQRLGLASLHQLRGRLARGPGAPSATCLLLGREDGRQRLRLLERCQDGFAVAATDLAQRGPGALYGLRQHGRLGLGAFDPEADGDLLDLLGQPEMVAWLAKEPGKGGCAVAAGG